MSVRASFVEKFGENEALRFEKAAEEHRAGTFGRDTGRRKGSDPFKWAICIVIGFECASKESYRRHHGIEAPWDDVKRWIKDQAQLQTHDGDFDYLALFSGAYNEFMPREAQP